MAFTVVTLKTAYNMQPTTNNHYEVNPALSFCFEVTDDKTHRSETLEFSHTRHSSMRASQRGIDQHKISLVLQYGECFNKQHLLYYILGEKNIPDALSRISNGLKNLVVIVAGDSNQIITCYRSDNPFKNIRLKSKRLSRALAA